MTVGGRRLVAVTSENWSREWGAGGEDLEDIQPPATGDIVRGRRRLGVGLGMKSLGVGRRSLFPGGDLGTDLLHVECLHLLDQVVKGVGG